MGGVGNFQRELLFFALLLVKDIFAGETLCTIVLPGKSIGYPCRVFFSDSFATSDIF